MKKNKMVIGDFSAFKKEFDELFATVKPGLEDKGYNIPKDAFDMYDLFIERYFNEGETSGTIEYQLTREDFRLFHEMIERKLHLTGEVMKRIRIFADAGKEKYREACMLILIGFESDIKILKPIEKTSVILKHIIRDGYLKNVQEKASIKSMCGWIDSYRSQYYPNWKKE